VLVIKGLKKFQKNRIFQLPPCNILRANVARPSWLCFQLMVIFTTENTKGTKKISQKPHVKRENQPRITRICTDLIKKKKIFAIEKG